MKARIMKLAMKLKKELGITFAMALMLVMMGTQAFATGPTMPTVDWATTASGLDFSTIIVGIVALLPAVLTLRFTMIGIKKGIGWLISQVKKA